MLFNEPKLLKYRRHFPRAGEDRGFSALQRAEIAEINEHIRLLTRIQRFSALQRAEIAEIGCRSNRARSAVRVSVLFNEPKLLKYSSNVCCYSVHRVSVLFNEPKLLK